MFHKGDYVVYGFTGVCQIKDIGQPDFSLNKKSTQYYTLTPMHNAITVYAPVDTNEVMRPVISREMAMELIKLIPTIQEDSYDFLDQKTLVDSYEMSLQEHSPMKLAQLIKSIYIKNFKKTVNDRKGTISKTDQTYLKMAEDLLYDEISIALDISIDDAKQKVVNAIKDSFSEEEKIGKCTSSTKVGSSDEEQFNR